MRDTVSKTTSPGNLPEPEKESVEDSSAAYAEPRLRQLGTLTDVQGGGPGPALDCFTGYQFRQ